MKKILTYFFIFVMFMFTSGCDVEKPAIVYNKYPFSQETLPAQTNLFKPGDKVYYLVTLPKVVESRRLYIQIVKLGSENRLGYELIWGQKVHLKTEQVHYYTNYIVINSAGTYGIRIYSEDNPTKILVSSEFYVRN